jgi:hypothetical protein
MIENLDEFLIGIVLGVRFRANFSIEDQLGRILDDILYKKGSSFGPKIFPNAMPGIGGRQLLNHETGDTLTIDNSNFILELNVSPSISIQEMPGFIAAYDEEIVRGIMKSYHIREIARLGYVRRYLFTVADLSHRFVNKTIGSSLEGVNDINLSFSKKIPTDAAISQRDVDDYHNVIFNVIKRSDKDEMFMSIDYQKVFVPFLPSVNEIQFTPFIQGADRFNQEKYLPWLNTNYVEEQNEQKS